MWLAHRTEGQTIGGQMRIDQASISDLLAVCGFSFIGLVVSARVLFELTPLSEMTSFL
jgi:hypothetical protein